MLFFGLVFGITFIDFEALIKKYDTVVVGRMTCKFTRRALLTANNVPLDDDVLNNYPNHKDLYKLKGNSMFVDLEENPTLLGYLKSKYNRNTIPFVFVNESFVGGFTEFRDYKNAH